MSNGWIERLESMSVSPAELRRMSNTGWDKPLSGSKYDSGKLPMGLLDPKALAGLAAVLQFGANKYAAHNWRGGIEYSRLIDALMRHLFALLDGEDIDPESGLPHVDHLGCCWMFLSHMMKTRPDLDDRYKDTKDVGVSIRRPIPTFTGDLPVMGRGQTSPTRTGDVGQTTGLGQTAFKFEDRGDQNTGYCPD